MGDDSNNQHSAIDSACDYSVGNVMFDSDDEPWQWYPDPYQTSREEPECCKCEATRAPVRTPDSKPNSSVWSLLLSIMITGLMFGALIQVLGGLT